MKVRTSALRTAGLLLAMILILFCVCSCTTAELAPEKVPTKAELAIKFGIEESVIDDHHREYPKVTDLPSEESEFKVDTVVLIVYQFTHQYEYTPEDFAEVLCESVEPLIGPYDDAEDPTRFLILKLNTKSRRQLIEAIKLLQQRADVYIAEPDFLISMS